MQIIGSVMVGDNPFPTEITIDLDVASVVCSSSVVLIRKCTYSILGIMLRTIPSL